MDNNILKFFLLFAFATCVNSKPCIGECPDVSKDLTAKELESEKIKNYTIQGVLGVYQEKSAELSSRCMELVGVVHSGAHKKEEGHLYSLIVTLNAIKSTIDECTDVEVDFNYFPPLTCEIVIWEKPFPDLPEDEKIEITHTCPFQSCG